MYCIRDVCPGPSWPKFTRAGLRFRRSSSIGRGIRFGHVCSAWTLARVVRSHILVDAKTRLRPFQGRQKYKDDQRCTTWSKVLDRKWHSRIYHYLAVGWIPRPGEDTLTWDSPGSGAMWSAKGSIWGMPKIGIPQNGWFIVENPIKIRLTRMIWG